jgi:Secretion system C-terminal sorting domain
MRSLLTFLFSFLLVGATLAQSQAPGPIPVPQPTSGGFDSVILTPFPDATFPLCGGYRAESTTVRYKTTPGITYGADNIFRIEFSNINGQFDNPSWPAKFVGTTRSTALNGTITFVVPENIFYNPTLVGQPAFKIRMTSTNPAQVSHESAVFPFQNCPTNPAATLRVSTLRPYKRSYDPGEQVAITVYRDPSRYNPLPTDKIKLQLSDSNSVFRGTNIVTFLVDSAAPAFVGDSMVFSFRIPTSVSPAFHYRMRAVFTSTPSMAASIANGHDISIARGNVAIATITAGGNTTFCQGSSVDLTASSADSYLWSNGATTRTISATTSGSYTVQTTTAGVQTPPSVAVVVTVVPVPATPDITSTGVYTFCQGESVLISSSAGNAYLWSTGETTRNITVTTSGSYTVQTITAPCTSAVSAPAVITVNPIPAQPTITSTAIAGGVQLSSSSATGNQWFFNGSPLVGETNQTISITNPANNGNYTVQVTIATCPSPISAVENVIVNSVSGRLLQKLIAKPNPTSGIITLEGIYAGNTLPLYIIDAVGRRVSVLAAPQGKVSVDMSALSPGIYVLQVAGQSIRVTKE